MKYKDWPRITEQTCIVGRQRPLSTSGKSTRILWFISLPTSARWGRSAKQWARFRHKCVRLFLGPLWRNGKKKLTRKQLYSSSVTDSLSSLSISSSVTRSFLKYQQWLARQCSIRSDHLTRIVFKNSSEASPFRMACIRLPSIKT